MSFGEQMRRRREELGLTRQQLAQRLGVSVSAVGNYETGVSAPKEEVLLRLFTALEAEPNYLYRGCFRGGEDSHSDEERRLLAKYRDLPLSGRQTVHSLVDALTVMTGELRAAAPAAEVRTIPLYTSPAAAGFAAPVFGEDYELIQVSGDVPPGAEPRPGAKRRRGHLLRGRRHAVQAVLPGRLRHGVSVLAEQKARGHGRDLPPGQRAEPDLLRAGDAPQPAPAGGTYIKRDGVSRLFC